MDKTEFTQNAGVVERAQAVVDAVYREDPDAFLDALHELTEWTKHCDKVVQFADHAVQQFFGWSGEEGAALRCSVCHERASIVCFSCRTRFCVEHTPRQRGEAHDPRVWQSTPDIVFLFQCSWCRALERNEQDERAQNEREAQGESSDDELSSSNRARSFVDAAFRHCAE